MTPVFQPAGAPGSTAATAQRSLGASQRYFEGQQSMMERASRQRMEEEAHRVRMEQTAILRPVAEAKAKADIAEANAHLVGVQQSEDMRNAANQLAPAARKAFDEMMVLADPEMREQAAFEWIGKYGQLANVGAFKDEWSAKKDIVAKIHVDASTLRNLNAKTAAEKELIAARGTEAEKVAGIRSETSVETAKIRAAGQSPEAVKLREAAAAARANNDEEGAKFYEAILTKKGHIAEPKKLEIERLRELRAAAEDAGDAAGAKEYTDRIAKLTTIVLDPTKQAIANVITGGGSATPKPAPAASPAPKPAPAPAPVPTVKPASQMSDEELASFMFDQKK